MRKKSAKVLEMEEFEQVEKTHHSGKKSKTPKLGAGVKMEEDIPSAQSIVTELATPKIKIKAPKAPAVTPKSTLAANLMQAPISVTPALPKSVKSGSVLGAQLNKPVSQFVPVQTSGILTTTVSIFFLSACLHSKLLPNIPPPFKLWCLKLGHSLKLGFVRHKLTVKYIYLNKQKICSLILEYFSTTS